MSSASNSVSPKRHAKYYLEDGNIIFLVESSLFRVHRYFFIRDSPVFADMLSIPVPPGIKPEGTTDSNPIKLPQVKTIDFERLLWVFYSPSYMTGRASIPAWFSILHLADEWQMETLRGIVINKLRNMSLSSIDKLFLGRQYNLDKGWILNAYVELCTRQSSLTGWEARRIDDPDIVCKIAQLREDVISKRLAVSAVDGQVLRQIIHLNRVSVQPDHAFSGSFELE